MKYEDKIHLWDSNKAKMYEDKKNIKDLEQIEQLQRDISESKIAKEDKKKKNQEIINNLFVSKAKTYQANKLKKNISENKLVKEWQDEIKINRGVK